MYEELIKAIRSVAVETGSLVCLGCGHEHRCSTHGCAILRRAVETLEAVDRQVFYARLGRVTAERDAAVALIEKVNNIAVGAIKYGPYQDGEEAKLFFEIDTLTRTPAKQGEEG